MSQRSGPLPALTLAGLLVAAACGRWRDWAAGAEPGQPFARLSAIDLGQFLAGRALFERAFTPEEGLGPLFNQDRCSSCHDLPAIGGTGVETEMKATRFQPPGTCDLLAGEGGDVVQERATPALRARGVERDLVPRSATAKTRLVAPALFGLGLLEAIPDQTILAREDPEDADGNSVSGRAGRTSDGRLGRFGHKADHGTLEDFVAAALHGEMGLTTAHHPAEQGVQGAPLPPGTDPTPEPEVAEGEIALLAGFVRLLAPPAPPGLTVFAERDSVRRGRQVFQGVGCTACHVPEMRTGPNGIPSLDRKVVALYSDLLLHDMGPDLADVCGPGAGPSEVRTARLLGLRHRARFLHDGRATTLEEAILLHEGEARAARDRFAGLSYGVKQYLFKFLNSL